MDPEHRLWFLEQTICYFLSTAPAQACLTFEAAFDQARFVDLEITDEGVAAELGLCEYTCRHLGLSAAASTWLAEHGWLRVESDPWSCYGRRGLLPDGPGIAYLVEAAYMWAYELPGDYPVSAVLEADTAADALVRILNERSGHAWAAFAT
ncbi:MAG TPA: hypothetical protein VND96_13555 [Candidatus Micrarchaeaceae archaeon]|nr:hypothetical protein [Candidatus Micrarchaeaceae archaeon]